MKDPWWIDKLKTIPYNGAKHVPLGYDINFEEFKAGDFVLVPVDKGVLKYGFVKSINKMHNMPSITVLAFTAFRRNALNLPANSCLKTSKTLEEILTLWQDTHG